MRKWCFGILALVAVGVWAPVLEAVQSTQTSQQQLPPLSKEFQPKPYTVGPGDRIRLEFYNLADTDADMKKEYLVEPGGTIQLKYIGAIIVNKLTTAAIEDLVEKALVDQKFYSAGVVTVTATVTEERLQSVQLQGHVITPGEKLLRGAQMTVSRAINAAGGFTTTAGQEIEIHRTVDGNLQVIKLTRSQLDGGDDPGLVADDKIIVKQGYIFFVNGEVMSPGKQAWSPEMTVSKAVALAGGFNAKGKLGYISRGVKDKDGKLKYVRIGNLKPETEILPDDQLHISRKICC